jgi:hypothetical protein
MYKTKRNPTKNVERIKTSSFPLLNQGKNKQPRRKNQAAGIVIVVVIVMNERTAAHVFMSVCLRP